MVHSEFKDSSNGANENCLLRVSVNLEQFCEHSNAHAYPYYRTMDIQGSH